MFRIDYFVVYTDFDYYIVSAENACLQRKSMKTQKEYEEKLIKTNYKCIDNRKYRLRIMPKDDYYNIKFSYNAKFLNYFNHKLSKCYCDDKQNKQFRIKNGMNLFM